jgi:diaminopimelate decarboxylase
MLTRDARGAVFGGVALRELFRSKSLRTPAYVYDLDAIAAEARALGAGFDGAPHLIAYAVKANSAGPILRTLAREGCGMEVVSGGELMLALRCGIPADRVLYSGVGKLAWEIDFAVGAGERGILALQMESIEEIARVEARASALGRTARVSLRVNPDVEADTHAHIATGHDEAKFGVPRADLPEAFAALDRAPHLRLVGLSCHVGSQLTQTDEYLAAARILTELAAARMATHPTLELIDFGGGFGIDYGAGCPVTPADFARAAVRLLEGTTLAGLRLVVEPGRSLVASHGLICASVIGEKRTKSGDRRFLIIDAGMNDLIRPALYAARHRIEPLDRAPSGAAPLWKVVGPVCESSDDFGEHPFETTPEQVILRDAGAYGYVMASEYNARALPPEVFLRAGEVVAVSDPMSVEAWVERRAAIADE